MAVYVEEAAMTDTVTVRLYDYARHMIATADVIRALVTESMIFKWRNRYFRRHSFDGYHAVYYEVPEPYNLDDCATECT